MEVYVARQPVFDRKMNTYGYELLYRRTQENIFDGTDSSRATAELIHNAFLVMNLTDLTDGGRGFINFSGDLLVAGVPAMLPEEQIVVEILETVEPTEEILAACRQLKKAGYLLALDDFVMEPRFVPLVRLADIIKVDFRLTPLPEQSRLMGALRALQPGLTFLAEKVETREEYETARQLGYHYFQGYFFARPKIMRGKTLNELNMNLLEIVSELNREDPRYNRITGIIERDFSLSFKLLKLANSAYFAPRSRISSIQQALVWIGMSELLKWINLMLLKEHADREVNELIKASMIRARVMENLARRKRRNPADHFMAGLFSSLDVILSRPMGELLEELPLNENVQEALLGKPGPLRESLDQVLLYESGDQPENPQQYMKFLESSRLGELFLEAIVWHKSIDS